MNETRRPEKPELQILEHPPIMRHLLNQQKGHFGDPKTFSGESAGSQNRNVG